MRQGSAAFGHQGSRQSHLSPSDRGRGRPTVDDAVGAVVAVAGGRITGFGVGRSAPAALGLLVSMVETSTKTKYVKQPRDVEACAGSEFALHGK